MLLPVLILLTKLLITEGNQITKDDFRTVVVDGRYSTNISVIVNSSTEYIIHFRDSTSTIPFTVFASSNDTNADFPVFIMVRQQKHAISWEIPLLVPSRNGMLSYRKTSRTLCHNNINKLAEMPRDKLYANSLRSDELEIHKRLAVSVSTASRLDANVTILVKEEDNGFYLIERRNYSVEISPSMPKYFYYKFPNGSESERTVVLEVNSTDDTCLTVSIQQATCPVFDLNQDIKYQGLYQTVSKKGGIIIKETEFPYGFFVVFVSKGDNYDCDWKGSTIPSQGFHNPKPSNRSSVVTFQVIPNISRDQYWVNSLLTLAVLSLFFVVFGMVSYEFCFCGSQPAVPYQRFPAINPRQNDPPQENLGNNSSQDNPSPEIVIHDTLRQQVSVSSQEEDPLIVPESNDLLYHSCNSSSEKASTNKESGNGADNLKENLIQKPTMKDADTNTEADDIIEDEIDKILDYRELYLSDLATKKSIHRESFNYFMHVISIGIFYGIPVFQLVITQQRIVNDTGNLDICYYNFLCAHPYIGLNDFNHFFSNAGYIFLGLLFFLNVRRHQNTPRDESLGIPKHYGLYYAMAVALGMEGFLSACYHICPNQSNFQFDTSFMYVMAILCIIKLYQNRHPDINATAYVVFLTLSVFIFIAMAGILFGYLWIWIVFTICYLLLCVCLSIQIYFVCHPIRGIERYLEQAQTDGVFNSMRLRKKARCVSLIIIIVVNIIMVVAGFVVVWGQFYAMDFGTYMLGLLMGNTFIYMVLYIARKINAHCCRQAAHEKISVCAALYGLAALALWGLAAYFFVNNSSEWTVSPAESRKRNTHCTLSHFYDYHDIWHFTSAAALFFSFMLLLTIDDGLANTSRDRILVF